MGNPPDDLSLERIDNDGPYSKKNCKWADRFEQGRNRRSCRMLEFKGEQLPLIVVAERAGLTHACLTYRLDIGLSADDAAAKPLRTWTARKYMVEGMPLKEASAHFCIPETVLRKRLDRGLTGDRLLQPLVFKPRRS